MSTGTGADSGFMLDPSQEVAVDLACNAPFGVITGGPGVGKSTCLRTAILRMEQRGETFALAAPTGKAAKRLSETTGREATTLHRLLSIGRDGRRTTTELLDVGTVIVDEASMLDVQLAHTLISSVLASTRIILVGDANQLPSVGPGRILGDLVEAGMVPMARLTTVHRSAAKSWVCRNAPNVLAGHGVELAPQHDFLFVEVERADDVTRAVTETLAKEPYQGAQVLCPQRTTSCGVETLNVAIQAAVNPVGEGWTIGSSTFRVGDRVIHTANNYTLEVFNGELGHVVSVDDRWMVVDFGDRKVRYSKVDATQLDLAYALTVHKFQGSETPWVIVVVHSAHTFMLTRQLFYTAITRAKKGVVIVGNRKGLEVATSAKMPPPRQTGLIARMRNESEASMPMQEVD